MPVLQNQVNTRLEILKTLYRQSDKRPDQPIKLDPAQIDGGYYSEINFQLRFLQDRGLVNYNGNVVSRRFRVSLTKEGVEFMEDSYQALALSGEEKDLRLESLFQKLR
ncbi:MAG: hypothetical protein CVU86_02635 [Firmicutes bacterium HGW-Firmicutes-11]|nr:MAG: hypothetical protein CVU86_02635 [Firmicutes bacterium HGW-Firmicutes-11]